MFSASKTSGPSGYNISNSLRFRGSASAYLNRTPASAGNRQVMTYSFWVKRGALSTDYNITNATTDASNRATLYFNSSNSQSFDVFLRVGGTNYSVTTSQVFRDPSAWYHIVVAIDTTQATSSNRTKVYVNGTQVTAFSTANYVPQNSNLALNNSVVQYIGYSSYFDGYMAEVNFIDGQALTPSSFGSTNATTGVWQPAKYTGTYGTNGFYLKFSDIATTSGSNAGLGKDFSGNSNYWTTNNISVTAGATYDAMTDSPTLTSSTICNYAVMSPIDYITASGTLSAANLNWASSTNVCGNRATIGASSGKWYWEAVGSSVTSGTVGGRFAFTGSDTIAVEQDKFGMYWHPTSGIARIVNGTNTYVTSAYTYTNSDVLALALDLDNNISYWYKNGVLQYTYDFSSFSTIGTRTFFPYVWNASSGTPSWVYNFGQRAFSYTPPTGYSRLNTYNLPTSTIVKGNSYMDATAYTGTNGSPTTQVISSNFQPDFLWFKKRSAAYDHALIDTNRGITKQLYSNLTNAEGTDSNVLTAIGASSFTVGNSNYSNYGTLVAWTWKANAGSTSSNTSGSITSTVQANTTAGFSIVTYTGTGANATVGHGLGVAPKMIIVKSRSTAGTDWPVYHASTGATGIIPLDLASAFITISTPWNNTAPTSSVFTVGTSGDTNGSTRTYVAYCWAEIAGFSKFGSYTGNYNVNGPFVYCGFRPKFILIKCTTQAYDWELIDTSRSTYNGASNYLQPNLSSAEYSTTSDIMDILSNGFKLRTNWTRLNDSSPTPFIFMAFAENPFKNALAR
jgi:hypothetical protein